MTPDFIISLILLGLIGGHAHWRFTRKPAGWPTQLSVWVYAMAWVVPMLPGGGHDYWAAAEKNTSIDMAFWCLGLSGLLLLLARLFLFHRKNSRLHARCIWFMHAASCLVLLRAEFLGRLMYSAHGDLQ